MSRGSCITIACINKVSEGRSEGEMLIKGARLMQKARPQLKEFHTRAQKKAFRSKLSNVTKVLPSVADMIYLYKELTLDASTSNHPATQKRLRLIFLGHEGLLGDLRHLNPGRPSGTFDVFLTSWQKLLKKQLLLMNVDKMYLISLNGYHLKTW